MPTLLKNTKSFKINTNAPAMWRKIFLIHTNPLYLKRTKLIYDRCSTLPNLFLGSYVKIYSGNKFHKRYINKWMIGYKYGEFSWTRKLALYKAKQLKKKKK